MRLAYFSPLPPTRSGIADYSAELLPRLAARAEVDAFANGARSSDPSVSGSVAVSDWRDFAARQRERPYDAALYQMGNHIVHDFVYQTLIRFPGVTVLHEPFLHHFAVQRTIARGDPLGYFREMAYSYGAKGIIRAARAFLSGYRFPVHELPLCERVVDASLCLIVHSEHARSIVLERRPRARVAVVKHHVRPVDVPAGRLASIRQSLGVGEDDLLFASFGLATPEKRLDLALAAFRAVRQAHPRATFAVVGDMASDVDLRGLVADLGLADAVRVTGYVSGDDLPAYVAAADVGVCLRWPTLGETSGVLLRLLNAGRPTVVLDVGAFGEFPDDCLRKVPVDGHEQEGLTEALLDLATNADARRAMGERARAYVREHHAIDRSADAYIAFVHEVLGR